MVRLLINKGADPDLATFQGATPLGFAASEGHVEVVQLLLDHEAKVNLATNKGTTPLSFAAQKGHVEVARQLIEKGADVDQATIKKATPLYFAAKLGNNKMVELLLANGADPNKKAERFRLWFFPITRSPCAAARRYHGNEETVEMIRAAKALKKRNIVRSFEYSPLLAGQFPSFDSIRQDLIGPE